MYGKEPNTVYAISCLLSKSAKIYTHIICALFLQTYGFMKCKKFSVWVVMVEHGMAWCCMVWPCQKLNRVQKSLCTHLLLLCVYVCIYISACARWGSGWVHEIYCVRTEKKRRTFETAVYWVKIRQFNDPFV